MLIVPLLILHKPWYIRLEAICKDLSHVGIHCLIYHKPRRLEERRLVQSFVTLKQQHPALIRQAGPRTCTPYYV
jgi:hypothetical protein